MMVGLPERTFIERWITPTIIFSVASAIVGQLLFTVWWARGETSRITAVEVAISGLRNDIFTFNTPLSARVLKLEASETNTQRAHTDLHARIDQIDQNGTRALALISSNQQRVMNQVDRLAERLIMVDKRISDTDAKTAQTAVLATERMSAVDKRLEMLERRMAELIALIAHPSGQKLQSEESRPYEFSPK